MSIQTTAREIMKYVGGAENIRRLTYCATRLRFELADRSKADQEKIGKIEGVIGVNINKFVFQVIIGADVLKVYNELNGMLENRQPAVESQKRKHPVNAAVSALSASMTPLIPAIYAAGLLSAVLALLKAFGLVSAGGGTYTIINSIQQAIFYFLPVFVGYSAARNFGCNPYIGMALGATLVFGAINGAEGLSFLGIPLQTVTYNSTILPVILGVWFMSYVDRLADRVLPKSLVYFVKPMLSLLISVPFTLLIFGPMGFYIGKFLGWLVIWLSENIGGWIVPAVKGLTTTLSVVTGTTGFFVPIVMGTIAELGFDPLIMPGSMASNLSVGGAVLALALKTKNKETRQLAVTSGTTALLGISEPAVYGILINHKKVFFSSMAGGAIGGLVAGTAGIRCYAPIASVIGLPAYIDDTGSNFLFAVIAAITAFIVGFLLVWVQKIEEPGKSDERTDIFTPVKGDIMALTSVSDDSFSSLALGKGSAVYPRGDVIKAPADGNVNFIIAANHAVSMITDEGIELLIHIGINTVRMEESQFNILVSEGENVKKGQPLIEIDVQRIEQAGYDPTVILVVTNTETYTDVIPVQKSEVNDGDILLSVMK